MRGLEEAEGMEWVSKSMLPCRGRALAVFLDNEERLRGRCNFGVSSVLDDRRSYMCNVPLSEVLATSWLLGEMERE